MRVHRDHRETSDPIGARRPPREPAPQWKRPEERLRPLRAAIEGLLQYAGGDPVSFYPESEELNQLRISGQCFLAAGLGFGEIERSGGHWLFRPYPIPKDPRRWRQDDEFARLWGPGADGTYRPPDEARAHA